MHAVQEIAAHAVYAVSVSNLIEKVGAYAGFAAVVGLAVLTALYFSQARDVKRLREWAGRAPERSAEAQSGGRTPQAAAVRTGPAAGQPASTGTVSPAQPVRPGGQAAGAAAAGGAAAASGAAGPGPQTGQGKPVTAPVAKPATAQGGAAVPATAATPAGAAASSAGAAPATSSAAGAVAAKPAGDGANPGQGAAGAGAASGTPAAAGAATATPGSPTATPDSPATGLGQGANSGGAAPATNAGTGAKVLPARPVQPQRPRPIPTPGGVGGHTAVIPPATKSERRWTAPRYLALIVAGVIVLGLGGTVGVVALTGGDSGTKKSSPSVALPNGGTNKVKSPKKKAKSFPPAIDPASVTVAVLNGTQVTGLASSTGQKVSAAGFRLGNVATATQQAPRTESVVLYQPGQSRQARAVARKLDISQIEPIDSQSAGLAGSANVVVVVGADKANG